MTPTTSHTIAAVLCLWSAFAAADTLRGRVVGVTDGDTTKVLDAANRQEKIRLADIDTPERGQPWGQRSKQALSGLVFGRQVVVEYRKRDRYGRIVGRVFVGDVDISRELVEAGHAWVWMR